MYHDGYYESYSSSTFFDLGTIAGTEYDVAHVKWGGNWTMPTYAQFYELIQNCDLSWTTINGVAGKLFTSKVNSNTIFLPTAGARWDKDLSTEAGFYWTATPMGSGYTGCSYCGYFYSNYGEELDNTVDDYNRRRGMSVRPVITGNNN